MSPPAVSWIAVGHHSSRQAAVALASLRREARETGIEVEAVLVDHSESAEEVRRLRALDVDILVPRPNRGYAAGLNSGWQAAGGAVLLFSNPDVEFAPGSLRALVDALEHFPIVGPQFVLGEFLLPPADPQTLGSELWRRLSSRSEWGRRAALRREARRWLAVWEGRGIVEVPGLSGALLACHREVAAAVGPWNEDYFLYFEETDWLRRARSKGLRLGLVPESRVSHHWGHASDPGSAKAAAWFAESRRRYYGQTYGRLGTWLSAEGRSPTLPSRPELPAELLMGTEPMWWLLSPSPAGMPSAGARLPGVALGEALREAAARAPVLGQSWVTPWPPGATPGATYRVEAVRGTAVAKPRRSRVRRARPEDVEPLVELFSEKFGYPVSPETWRWKYDAVPGQSCSVVVEDANGRITAHAGALGHAARSRGVSGDLFQLCDYVSRRTSRGLMPDIVRAGRSLLEELTTRSGFSWVYGFPSAKAFAVGTRPLEYRPLRHLALWRGALPAVEGADPSLIEVGDRAGTWSAEAWSAARVEGVVRSQAFLDWRYTARPDRYYRFFRLRADVDGLAVFGFHQREASAAELWLPEGTDWRPHLAAVAANLREVGMESWSFWPPSSAPARQALEALSVKTAEETVFVGVRSLRRGVDPAAAAREIHFSRGDYDLT